MNMNNIRNASFDFLSGVCDLKLDLWTRELSGKSLRRRYRVSGREIANEFFELEAHELILSSGVSESRKYLF